MTDDAERERLRQEFGSLLDAVFDAMFDKVLALGIARGQALASSILDDVMANAMAKLKGVAGAPPGRPESSPAPESPSQTEPLRQAPKQRQRATPGAVQGQVERILGASPVPLTVQKIIGIGAHNGVALKESSVRMALMSLRDNGKAEQINKNDWRMISGRYDSSLFTGTSRPTDATTDGESARRVEEADVA